jgi:RES domain
MPKSISLFNAVDPETFEVEMPRPLDPKRMVPRRDRADEGRVNPKGIPCLYLSTERDTAMTEVRPWIGTCVSVGQFIILRKLNVVDCSMDNENSIDLRTDPEKVDKVWRDINRAFSEPVTRSDDIAEYAPTQVLAEAFRSAGYDGLVYGTKLGIGRTVALFDLNDAELVNCEGFRVKSVNLTFSPAASMYCADKYLDSDDGEINDPTAYGYPAPAGSVVRDAALVVVATRHSGPLLQLAIGPNPAYAP